MRFLILLVFLIGSIAYTFYQNWICGILFAASLWIVYRVGCLGIEAGNATYLAIRRIYHQSEHQDLDKAEVDFWMNRRNELHWTMGGEGDSKWTAFLKGMAILAWAVGSETARSNRQLHNRVFAHNVPDNHLRSLSVDEFNNLISNKPENQKLYEKYARPKLKPTSEQDEFIA